MLTTRRVFLSGVAGLLLAPAAVAAAQSPPERGLRAVRLWNRLCESVARQNGAFARLNDSYHRRHPQATVPAAPEGQRCSDLADARAEAAVQLECLTGLQGAECGRR